MEFEDTIRGNTIGHTGHFAPYPSNMESTYASKSSKSSSNAFVQCTPYMARIDFVASPEKLTNWWRVREWPECRVRKIFFERISLHPFYTLTHKYFFFFLDSFWIVVDTNAYETHVQLSRFDEKHIKGQNEFAWLSFTVNDKSRYDETQGVHKLFLLWSTTAIITKFKYEWMRQVAESG